MGVDSIIDQSTVPQAPVTANTPATTGVDSIIDQSTVPASVTATKGVDSIVDQSTLPGATKAQPATKIPPIPGGLNLTSPPPKIDTSGLFSSFMNANNLTTPAGSGTTPAVTTTNVEENLGKIPGAVSDAISGTINAPLNKASDLLSNTDFMQQAAAGVNAGAGGVANQVLSKLSNLTASLSGLTGGIYQPQKTGLTDNSAIGKGISILSQGLGMMTGIGLIGNAAAATETGASAVEGLTNLANRFPLVAKYVVPFIKPLVENTAGLAIYGQLDPNLAGNLKARVEKIGTDIATAPLYTALGAIKNPIYSLPPSFALGYSMAKLSGANNQTALSSGAAFAFMDLVGKKVFGDTSFSDVEKDNIKESLQILQPYSDTKLTPDSSLEDFKKAFHRAAFQTHPDVGGNDEAFNSVREAFDLLSKGAVGNSESNQTDSEKSIKLLSGDVQKGIKEFGPDATHLALQENLGIDKDTASRLVQAGNSKITMESLQNGEGKQILPNETNQPSLFETTEPKAFTDTTGTKSIVGNSNGTELVEHNQGENPFEKLSSAQLERLKNFEPLWKAAPLPSQHSSPKDEGGSSRFSALREDQNIQDKNSVSKSTSEVNKPSGLGKSIEQKAIDAKLTKGFENVAGYTASTIKEQAKLSTDLVNNDLYKARQIIRGEAPLPDRLRGSSLIVAMEQYLKQNPNVTIAHELANSPLTSAVSQAGSELGLMQNREQDSLTVKAREIKAAREAALEKKTGKTIAKVKSDTIKEMKKAAKVKVPKETWQDFVKLISCAS